jgi:hypothetical protein
VQSSVADVQLYENLVSLNTVQFANKRCASNIWKGVMNVLKSFAVNVVGFAVVKA